MQQTKHSTSFSSAQLSKNSDRNNATGNLQEQPSPSSVIEEYVLVPKQQQRSNNDKESNIHHDDDVIMPFIPMNNNTSSSSKCEESTIIGRRDVLVSYHTACGCRPTRKKKKKKRRKLQNNNIIPPQHKEEDEDCGSVLCEHCKQVETWAIRAISRKMVRLTRVSNKNDTLISNDCDDDDNSNGDVRYRIQVRGANAYLVHVEDVPVINTTITEKKECSSEWRGSAFMRLGSTLSFVFRMNDENLNDVDKRREAGATGSISGTDESSGSNSIRSNFVIRFELATRCPNWREKQQAHATTIPNCSTSRKRLFESKISSDTITHPFCANENETSEEIVSKDTDDFVDFVDNDDSATQLMTAMDITPRPIPPSRDQIELIDVDEGDDAYDDVCPNLSNSLLSNNGTDAGDKNEFIGVDGTDTSAAAREENFKFGARSVQKGNTSLAASSIAAGNVDVTSRVKPLLASSIANAPSKQNVLIVDVDDDIISTTPQTPQQITKQTERVSLPTTNLTKKLAVAALSDRAPTPVQSNLRRQCSTPPSSHRQYYILHVALGKSMPKSRIRILETRLRSKRNVALIDSLQKSISVQKEASNTTHVLVIDANVSAIDVSKSLGYASVKRMATSFVEHDVITVKPEWVVQQITMEKDLATDPTLDQSWGGLMFDASSREIMKQRTKKTITTVNQNSGWIRKIKKVDGFAPITVVKASSQAKNGNKFVSRILQQKNQQQNSSSSGFESNNGLSRRRKLGDYVADGNKEENRKQPISSPPLQKYRNKEIADMFDRLARLHKDSPLDANDEFRYKTFAIVASRLRHLNFQVMNVNVDRLKHIGGFGKSVIDKVREYLTMGTCQRIKELERDEDRIAMRNMMKIWGVGPVMAADLVKQNYKTISQIRKALSENRLKNLSRNAKIGVENYEDFNEKMDRDEVRQIGTIVIETCRETFPDSEMHIMGSYRRGSMQCGDVDVLITHPDYVESTPRGVLGRLVDTLMSRNHVSHHLTFLEGMKNSPGGLCGKDAFKHLGKRNSIARNNDDKHSKSAGGGGSEEDSTIPSIYEHYHGSQSYMGVFISPIFSGRRRRIDIKFYPYRQRAYASLYFTGPALFNRAIRLWATKVKLMTLNDHGLCPINRKSGNMNCSDNENYKGGFIKVDSEREIFHILGLEYRSATERVQGCDAVVAKGTSAPSFDVLDSKDSI